MSRALVKGKPTPLPDFRSFEHEGVQVGDTVNVTGEAGTFRVKWFDTKPYGVEVCVWGGNGWRTFMFDRIEG